MGKLYRKTEKGLTEVATRANRLPPRLRAALILVDGKRTDDELSSIIPAEPEEALRWLSESGFIEVAKSSSNASQWGTTGAGTMDTSSGEASIASSSVDVHLGDDQAATARNEPPPASRMPIEQIKRESVRFLTECVGPVGEGIAIKIEKARSREELGPLLDIARQVIGNTRGKDKATEFHGRFIDGLMV